MEIQRTEMEMQKTNMENQKTNMELIQFFCKELYIIFYSNEDLDILMKFSETDVPFHFHSSKIFHISENLNKNYVKFFTKKLN